MGKNMKRDVQYSSHPALIHKCAFQLIIFLSHFVEQMGKFRGHTCLVQCVYYSSSSTFILGSGFVFSHLPASQRQIFQLLLLCPRLHSSRTYVIFSFQSRSTLHTSAPLWLCLAIAAAQTLLKSFFVDVLYDLLPLAVPLCLCACCVALCVMQTLYVRLPMSHHVA